MNTHTIGEVLNRLKDEFDDVTISKIRFLEAEGLITPDRTESGYRKFTGADVDRLRYVLRAQRDRFLPLKVIRDELARIDAGLPVTAPAATPDPEEVAVLRGDGPDPGPGDETVASGDATGAPTGGIATNGAAGGGPPAAGRPTSSLAEPVEPSAGRGAGRPLLEAPDGDVSLSAAELADATGLTETDLAGLRDHGLLTAGPTHGADDLRVVELAAELLDRGLEARHLRMFRQFADREAALAEQLAAPLLRQRNPDSRTAASERVEQLAELGGELHRALLSRQLRALLRS